MSWKDELPDELKNEPVIQQTKDVAGLASQLIAAQRMIGGSIRIPGKDAGPDDVKKFHEKLLTVPGVVRLPADDAPEEEHAAFLTRLGRPVKPEEYDVEPVEGDVAFADIAKGAHALGLTRKQFRAFYEDRRKVLEGAKLAHANRASEVTKSLQEQYGADVEPLMARGAEVFDMIADDRVKEAFNVTGLAHDPAVKALFAKLGDMLDEESVTKFTGRALPRKVDHPEDLRDRINEIRRNPEHPYNKPKDPGHAAALAEVNLMYQRLFPDKK